MSDRIDKLLTRLRKGIAKSVKAFDSLDGAEWDLVLYDEPYAWTVRDLLAHFLSAEEGLRRLAQHIAAGGPGVSGEFDYHAFNASEHERLTSVPRGQLLDQLRAARQDTIAWVATLEEAHLNRVGGHPALGEITVETFINTIYGHQLMHMRDLMQVLN
jgi:hypothetical protein